MSRDETMKIAGLLSVNGKAVPVSVVTPGKKSEYETLICFIERHNKIFYPHSAVTVDTSIMLDQIRNIYYKRVNAGEIHIPFDLWIRVCESEELINIILTQLGKENVWRL